ncbi:MAG: alpha-ketoacid dehydrogenase subunit beta, partial [Porticoccus sp.]|nr:alpha-ketoacid dehydrogenase subunit beta [Porticoccus sp.]
LEFRKINFEHIDLVCCKPLDVHTIITSVKKTGRLIVLDTGFKTNSISSEIITIVNENCFKRLKYKPVRITVPDVPEPTSYGLTKYYYFNSDYILNKILTIFNKKVKKPKFKKKIHHDVPGEWFKGPF